ncbi:MAG: hypothetical protein RMJ56_15085 [Gemmataceae bacterium]|nr:hypothetical protein [Gemmata sp.]MDW8198920.1 hypothetical protein [Gemmataceae bacterium]
MQHLMRSVCVTLVLMTIPACGGNPDPQTILDKALAAHGGREVLSQFPAITIHFQGIQSTHGLDSPLTGTTVALGSDKSKTTIQLDVVGRKTTVTNVVVGDKGWIRDDKITRDMTPDELAEAKEQAHAAWVSRLFPLQDPQYTLTPLESITVDDKPAWGVQVSRAGYRPIKLYFDQQTGLLAKVETRVRDENSPHEVNEETILSQYTDVQNTRQPMRLLVKRNGQMVMDVVIKEVKLAAAVDEKTFAKP